MTTDPLVDDIARIAANCGLSIVPSSVPGNTITVTTDNLDDAVDTLSRTLADAGYRDVARYTGQTGEAARLNATSLDDRVARVVFLNALDLDR